jgi:hypothetical protein
MGSRQVMAMQVLLSTLMESPIYWMMPIKERLDLIHQLIYKNDTIYNQFRQKALLWVRTGTWKEGDSMQP